MDTSRKDMLLMGDFNMDFLNWTNTEYNLKELVDLMKLFLADVTMSQVWICQQGW